MAREIETDCFDTYSPEVVGEIALAMKAFLRTGMTSSEAQAAVQAYARIRAADISSLAESYQRREDRSSAYYRGQRDRNDTRVR